MDEMPPFILARASITKNKRDERVLLVPELSEKLKSFRTDQSLPSDPVFANGVPSMRMLRKGFGKADIQYCDDKGRYADFHARHSCSKTVCPLCMI